MLNSVTEQPVNYRTNQLPDMHNFRQQAAETLMSSYANAAKHSPTTSDTTNEVPRNDESQVN